MKTTHLWFCLRHPRAQLRALDETRNLPYTTWAGLTFIAVAGSMIYGASLSLVFPQWRVAEGAMWLTLSAGLSWCVFGPALVLLTRRHIFTCAHACLVTMAYGEAVLVTGACVNGVIAFADGQGVALFFNIVCVALSNVVMATALALQLQAVRVPVWKTLLAWTVFLNGSGAVFFWIFQRTLRGG
jgi:hypothetical protein